MRAFAARGCDHLSSWVGRQYIYALHSSFTRRRDACGGEGRQHCSYARDIARVVCHLLSQVGEGDHASSLRRDAVAF